MVRFPLAMLDYVRERVAQAVSGPALEAIGHLARTITTLERQHRDALAELDERLVDLEAQRTPAGDTTDPRAQA